MSTGVGLQQWKVTERPASIPNYATRGAVGPGPSQNANRGTAEYGSSFASLAGVTAGTGWTYAQPTRRFTFNGTPVGDSDLTVALQSSIVAGVRCRARVALAGAVLVGGLDLIGNGTVIASIPAGARGVRIIDFTSVGTLFSLTLRAKSGVVTYAEIDSLVVNRDIAASDTWHQNNAGQMVE